MQILDAQREMRSAFLGGFAGQTVAGLIWLVAAAVGTFHALYGMRMYALLAAVLVLAGASLALYGPPVFELGAWLTGAVLIVAGAAARSIVLREERTTLTPSRST